MSYAQTRQQQNPKSWIVLGHLHKALLMGRACLKGTLLEFNRSTVKHKWGVSSPQNLAPISQPISCHLGVYVAIVTRIYFVNIFRLEPTADH